MTDERAVSQSIGFVLTFAVIVTSVALVATVGFDQVESVRTDQQLENAERSFRILGGNVDEIQAGRAVVRGGELDVDEGAIGVVPHSDSRLRVAVDGTAPTSDYERTFAMGGLRYRLADTTVAYEGGAIFRDQGAGTVLQDGPAFVCSGDRAVVSVVTVDADAGRQLGGGTVSVTVTRNRSAVYFPTNRSGVDSTDGRADVTVEVVDSPFATGWGHYFSDHAGWESTGTPGEYVCDGPTGAGVASYHVVRTRVNVSITR